MGRASVLLITLAALLAVGSAQQRGAPVVDECNPNVLQCNFSLLEKLDDLRPPVTIGRSGANVDVEEHTIPFEPKLPGEYEFTLTSTDLCSELNHTTNVFVRCPPAPDAIIKPISGITAGGTVLQRTRVKLSSEGSKAQQEKTAITMTWKWISVPAEENRTEFTIHNTSKPYLLKATESNGVQTYETPELRISGTYKIDLTVNDGCSTKTARFCFRVTCNCGPIANAGNTPTLWTRDQNKNTNAGVCFTLDGSLSYDFDLAHSTDTSKEVLSYSWDFLEWVPAGVQAYSMGRAPFGAGVVGRDGLISAGKNTFSNDFLPRTTRTWTVSDFGDGTGRGEYYIKVDKTTGDLVKTYTFTRKQQGTSTGSNTVSNQIGRGVTVIDGKASNTSTIYPRYITTEEDFMVTQWPADRKPLITEPTTTTCMATITTSTQDDREEVEIEDTTTVCGGAPSSTIEYCSIRLTQKSTDSPMADLCITPDWASSNNVLPPEWHQNPARSYKSFEMCRGLWKFSLTVQDGCGTEQQDVDTVHVTLRCNRPPVAIAGKNLHVVYKPQTGFDQVTVDGRSSFDPNYDVLTYFWRFESYPKEHETKGCAGRKNGHKACTQSYCTQVTEGNYATNPADSSKAFGNKASVGGGPAGYTDYATLDTADTKTYGECGVTVYPTVYSMTPPTGCAAGVVSRGDQCSFPIVSPTEYHYGNSAFFKPLAEGTYVIGLAVFDGCSVTTDSVNVVAVCPELSAIVQLTGSGRGDAFSTTYSTTMDAVSVNASIQYEGDRGALTYEWKAYGDALLNRTAPAHTFADKTSLSTTFTPQGSGQYYLVISVNDGCRTFTSPAVIYTVTCNQMPNSPQLTQSSSAGAIGPYLYSTTAPYAYPAVTITASANDINNDPISYRWIVTEGGLTATSATEGLAFPGAAGTNDSVVFTPSFSANSSGLRTFSVQAFARDACQENPQGGIVSVQFTCEAMQLLGGRAPQGAQIAPAATQFEPYPIVYEYDNNAFPSTTIDGAASTVVYTNNRKFDWCLAPDQTPCTSTNNDKAAQDANTQNSGSFTWIPDPSAPVAQDTVFTAKLTISDGCSQNDAFSYFLVSCPARPTAAMTTKSPIVEWDSNTRKFPTILLNGSDSTMARGATTMTYAFSSPSGLGNPVQDGATASYEPAGAGTIVFQLTVANGPCRSVNTASVTVAAQCMSLRLSLKNGNSHGLNTSPRGGSLLTMAYTWDGTRFPTACIDGLDSSYLTVGDGREVQGGLSGNFNALRYTWLVQKAPEASFLESAEEVLGQPSAPKEENVNSTKSTNREGCDVTVKRYTRVVTTKKTTKRTTLFNHHYNRPMTCFAPDAPGQYEVVLTAEDDCPLKETASVSVSTSCPARTQPTLRFTEPVGFNGQLRFNGTQFSRVTVDARGTATSDPRHTLTYDWTLEYATSVLNGDPTFSAVPDAEWKQYRMGTVATFVPTKPGLYRVTVCASDGCPRPDGPRADLCDNKVVTVTCERQYQTLNSTVKVGRRDANGVFVDSGLSTREVIYDGTSKSFQDMFMITGRALQPCSLKQFRWSLTKRSCTSSATSAPPPPTALTTCKHRCRWHVIKEPCTKGKEVENTRPSDRKEYNTETKTITNGDGRFTLVGRLKTGAGTRNTQQTANLNCGIGGPGGEAGNAYDGTFSMVNETNTAEAAAIAAWTTANKDKTNINTANIGGLSMAWPDSTYGRGSARDMDVSLGCTDEQDAFINPSTGLGECEATFTCGQYGTYKLRMTVYDGCQAVYDYTTVTCRCESRTIIQGLESFQSIFQCGTKKAYEFKTVELRPSFTRSEAPRLPNCPITPRTSTPNPAPAPRDRCCPTMVDVSRRCPCPRCPTCPACVTAGSVQRAVHNGVAYRFVPAPAPAAMPVGQRALLSVDEADVTMEVTEASTNGVVLPICAVLMLSMLANIMLYNKIQGRRMRSQEDKKVLEATML